VSTKDSSSQVGAFKQALGCFVALVVLLVLGIAGFWWQVRPTGPGYEEVAGGFYLDRKGVDVSYKNFRFVTRHKSNALVVFKCYKDGVLMAEEDRGVLHYMRWFLFLDEDEKLWFYSSDVGTKI